MSDPAGHEMTETQAPPRTALRLAVASLVMVAVNLPWFVVALVVGTVGMMLVGAHEGDLLTDYGAAGWLAWVLMLGVVLVPSAAGVILGAMARRRGVGTLASVGIAANVLVAVVLVASLVAQILVHGGG